MPYITVTHHKLMHLISNLKIKQLKWIIASFEIIYY